MAHVLCPLVVGRNAELQILREALTSALDGHGGCAVLVGEPGLGKSRLAREVTRWASEGAVPVATGRAVPASTTAAYRPLTEALLQLLRHRPLPDDPALATWLPALQPVLPRLVGDQQPGGEVSAAVRGEAVLQLLRFVAPEGLVMVLEDLHWADPDTVSLVEFLADNLAGERLLVVQTIRDSPPSPALETARRQRGRQGIAYLALDRLTEEDLSRMVNACAPEADAELMHRVKAMAEGVPLFVEELLAAPGLPETFAETVRARLRELDDGERGVIEAAAVLGRDFDWELLPAMTGQPEANVMDALGKAVDLLLMSSDGAVIRFRHGLTREAVLDSLLPPRHRALAGTALSLIVASDPHRGGELRDLAIDLAVRAGDRHQAGGLLTATGRQALGWGVLATAVDTLRRAADLLEGSVEQADAELLLIEALALAGRVDEAAAAGGRLITRLADDQTPVRIEAHLRLAQAAVAASRWQMARHHLDAARGLGGTGPPSAVRAQMAVLDADIAFAADGPDTARTIAEGVLAIDGAAPEARCHALEIIGRSHRSRDLASARAAFERSLVTAETADLPLWRLRALHELGTVDLFDHAAVERLHEARRAAEQMGALSTAAILDLQLSAAFTCRWELDDCDAHAHSAIEIAERLGLEQVRAKGLAMLTGSASMHGDLAETERWAGLTVAAAPEDKMLEGFCWGSRAVAILIRGDVAASIEPYARGMAILGQLPHAEPAALRALWPLVLASLGDRRAHGAVDEARRLGVGASHLNRGLIGYAEAVLAGRDGQPQRANELVATADTSFTNCTAWAHLARLLAAPRALAEGWVDAERWLDDAVEIFPRRNLSGLAEHASQLLRGARGNPWSSAGVSPREADVLRLVIDGLANKEIAARLHLSPRTVEKHVESLLRKAGVRSRTELVVAMSLRTAGPGEARRASDTT